MEESGVSTGTVLDFDISRWLNRRVVKASRAAWGVACGAAVAQFHDYARDGVVRRHQVQYLKDKRGRKRGCVVVLQADDGSWYAGGSWCCRRDQARFTKEEALARALTCCLPVPAHDDCDLGKRRFALWLANFPPSCRGTLGRLVLHYVASRN